ncbi:cytochrome c3 family protein [Geoglobus sp.]
MQHLYRALLVFVTILIVFLGAIFALRVMGEDVYPGLADKLLGVEGMYGISGEQKELAKKPVHAEGREYCRNCHAEIYEVSSRGKHDFDCQTCHGPAGDHPATKMKVENSREFCLGCHKPTVGRDESTIRLLYDWENHGKGRLCTACHNPHHPWFV